jgi:hypothetical protein
VKELKEVAPLETGIDALWRHRAAQRGAGSEALAATHVEKWWCKLMRRMRQRTIKAAALDCGRAALMGCYHSGGE